MDTAYCVEQVKALCAIDSPSGFTDRAADYLMEELTRLGYAPEKTRKGGVTVCLGGEGEGLLPPQMPAKPTKPAKQTRPSALASAHKNKRPPVFLATFTGLLLSAVVLLAATGLYGAYCYSQGLPGDTNVRASTLMYSLAVFFGCFWASAMVKRQSLKPLFFIGSIYIILSLVISYQLLDLADFKPMMILLKVLLTAGAALLGYFLSLIPYLINKRKKNRKKNGPAL